MSTWCRCCSVQPWRCDLCAGPSVSACPVCKSLVLHQAIGAFIACCSAEAIGQKPCCQLLRSTGKRGRCTPKRIQPVGGPEACRGVCRAKWGLAVTRKPCPCCPDADRLWCCLGLASLAAAAHVRLFRCTSIHTTLQASHLVTAAFVAHCIFLFLYPATLLYTSIANLTLASILRRFYPLRQPRRPSSDRFSAGHLPR